MGRCGQLVVPHSFWRERIMINSEAAARFHLITLIFPLERRGCGLEPINIQYYHLRLGIQSSEAFFCLIPPFSTFGTEAGFEIGLISKKKNNNIGLYNERGDHDYLMDWRFEAAFRWDAFVQRWLLELSPCLIKGLKVPFQNCSIFKLLFFNIFRFVKTLWKLAGKINDVMNSRTINRININHDRLVGRVTDKTLIIEWIASSDPPLGWLTLFRYGIK